MTSRPAHPLDVDLADLADGLLDAESAAGIDAHLGECVLCRLKHWRLLSAPAAGAARPFPSPAFAVPALEAGGDPAVGEVWLAGADERIAVVVLGAGGQTVLVAPLTLDVDTADDESEIVDSPLGPAVLHPALAADLPLSALVARLAGRVDRSTPTAGPPLAGDTDPRLALRSHLGDWLAPADDTPPPAGTEQVRSTLIADLRALRGAACDVRPLDSWAGAVAADRLGWTPLAVVDEVGIVLVALDTPHGLADDADFDAARAVLTRFNASALVVVAGELSDLGDVFDAASLNHGIDMPSGAHTPPRPLIAGLTAFDAIAKYLDQHSGARAMTAPSRRAVAAVDVPGLLRDAASAATVDVARQGARFKIAPKRRGYESVADAPDALGAALATAFTPGASVVEALLGLAGTDEAE